MIAAVSFKTPELLGGTTIIPILGMMELESRRVRNLFKVTVSKGKSWAGLQPDEEPCSCPSARGHLGTVTLMEKGQLCGTAVTPEPCSQVPSYAASAMRLGEGSTRQGAELQRAWGWGSSPMRQSHRVTNTKVGRPCVSSDTGVCTPPPFHLLSSRCAGG